MAGRLTRVEAELKKERADVSSRLAKVDNERQELLQKLQQVDDCLAALGSTEKIVDSPSKGSLKRADVETAVMELMNANGQIEVRDFEGLVKCRLRDNGKSLQGFALRIREIYRDLVEEVEPGHLSLKSLKASSA